MYIDLDRNDTVDMMSLYDVLGDQELIKQDMIFKVKPFNMPDKKLHV